MILDAIPENIPQGKFGEMIDIASPDEQIRNEFRTAFGISTKVQLFEKYRESHRRLLVPRGLSYHDLCALLIWTSWRGCL
jgi:hypothetical protein